MSTYYYMACDDCKKRTKEIIAVSRTTGQHIDHPVHLLDFMMEHRYCNLRFFSEHDDERLDYSTFVNQANEGDK